MGWSLQKKRLPTNPEYKCAKTIKSLYPTITNVEAIKPNSGKRCALKKELFWYGIDAPEKRRPALIFKFKRQFNVLAYIIMFFLIPRWPGVSCGMALIKMVSNCATTFPNNSWKVSIILK